MLRELDRFSDPTFDFEAAAKAQQAAATGASGASGAAPAKRSIGGGGSGKGKLGKFSAPGWASDKAISTHRLEAIKDGAVVFKLEVRFSYQFKHLYIAGRHALYTYIYFYIAGRRAHLVGSRVTTRRVGFARSRWERAISSGLLPGSPGAVWLAKVARSLWCDFAARPASRRCGVWFAARRRV